MFSKHTLIVCSMALVVILVVLDTTEAEAGHPQRPERFTSEEQLKKYLRELKQYYEENVRIGRFGKRAYTAPMRLFKSYPKHDETEWKNDYEYYAQFNQ